MYKCKPLSKEEIILIEKKQKIQRILERLPTSEQFELILHECGYIDTMELIEMLEEAVTDLILEKGYCGPFFLEEVEDKLYADGRHRLIMDHWNDDLDDDERIAGLLKIEHFSDRDDFIEFYLDSLWDRFAEEIEKETWFRVPCWTFFDFSEMKGEIRKFMEMQPERAKAYLEEMHAKSIEELSYDQLDDLYHVLNPIIY